MADFCKECSIKIFKEDYGDFANIAPEGKFVEVLCEECGPIYVDHTGSKIIDSRNVVKKDK